MHYFLLSFFYSSAPHRHLHSFPTRRSSDLPQLKPGFDLGIIPGVFIGSFVAAALAGELNLEGFSDGRGMRRYLVGAVLMGFGDRKSTRLNSSHTVISYAVFCLKKKKK